MYLSLNTTAGTQIEVLTDGVSVLKRKNNNYVNAGHCGEKCGNEMLLSKTPINNKQQYTKQQPISCPEM